MDTMYIMGLRINIFSVTHAMKKEFNLMREKESLIFMKNETVLEF